MAADGGCQEYLDWVVSPALVRKNPDASIWFGREILDEDHYGLEKPKERILEYLDPKLGKKMKGPILCLVDRRCTAKLCWASPWRANWVETLYHVVWAAFVMKPRFTGHSSTYIGSMPGQGLQSIKKSEPRNHSFSVG
jgi:ATP-dependent Lon protease